VIKVVGFSIDKNIPFTMTEADKASFDVDTLEIDSD
jgi:hypothetical protein